VRHGSLFSGIGGFDLAAEWMGWKNVFQVEKDPFCQRVLEKNFPTVTRYGDIKEFDGTKYRGAVDIITGGFPCQPFSSAGNRKGTEDDRYLWPEMLRIISEAQPSWVVGENVSGFATMDVNTQVYEMADQESSFLWFKKVAQEVVDGLNSIGYDVPRTNKGEPILFSLPACGVDAPHQRDRIWIIAYPKSDNDRRTEREIYQKNGRQDRKLLSTLNSAGKGLCGEGVTANAERNRSQGRSKTGNENGKGNEIKERCAISGIPFDNWQNFPTQPPLRDGNDGISSNMVRSAIQAGGNAIVPQVAYEIFKAIQLNNLTP
jgi:DNA (cytosine-5)-methyltransferase 1